MKYVFIHCLLPSTSNPFHVYRTFGKRSSPRSDGVSLRRSRLVGKFPSASMEPKESSCFQQLSDPSKPSRRFPRYHLATATAAAASPTITSPTPSSITSPTITSPIVTPINIFHLHLSLPSFLLHIYQRDHDLIEHG